MRVFVIIGIASIILAGTAVASPELLVRVDARDVARKHVHSDMTLQVKPGALTLVYPKWIPAEHAPGGPLESIIGLEIKAGGVRLQWSRNPIDMYAIDVNVPAGARTLNLSMDIGLAISGDGFSSTRSSSEQLAVLRWNEFVLLPKGRDAQTISTSASVLLPANWSAACALPLSTLADGSVELEPASLTRLIDSPVQFGRFTKRIDLPGSEPAADLHHSIAIAADSAAALVTPEDFAKGYERLVAESGALFGSRLYRHYTWLLTLSDQVTHFGEEHHESSDNRSEELALTEADRRVSVAGLLGHEYVHSWNGKYRRPKGLLSPDYQQPMDGSLLWVYEGLTQFWGDVLPTRAGLLTAQDYQDLIATAAAHFDISSGPNWRPLADTAVQAQVLYNAPSAWESARRGVDFYDGSIFLWLDVDSEIRSRTGGAASLDDFMKRFYAGTNGNPALKTYQEQDVYDTLASVAPGDWRTLIRKHLDVTGTQAMLASLERAGWKLSYTAEKNSWVELRQKQRKGADRQWSIGLRLDEKGLITDTIEDRAAARAGAGPGMTVIAVNGRKYTPEILDAAMSEAHASRKPIELLLQNDDYFRTLSVPYFDGQRFPHLLRVEARPDTLSAVLKSRLQR